LATYLAHALIEPGAQSVVMGLDTEALIMIARVLLVAAWTGSQGVIDSGTSSRTDNGVPQPIKRTQSTPA